MTFEDDDLEMDALYHQQEAYSRNINAPTGVHIMNKNEAKLCRKLMAETGLTETELRTHKKYRKMLSDEQKKGTKAKLHPIDKARRDCMKTVTKLLKLPKEHPTVIKAYKEEWERRRQSTYGYRSVIYMASPF